MVRRQPPHNPLLAAGYVPRDEDRQPSSSRLRCLACDRLVYFGISNTLWHCVDSAEPTQHARHQYTLTTDAEFGHIHVEGRPGRPLCNSKGSYHIASIGELMGSLRCRKCQRRLLQVPVRRPIGPEPES